MAAYLVTVSSCTVVSDGMQQAYGGGIYAHGEVDLIASTIAHNDALAGTDSSGGGGVFARTVLVFASTVSGNLALSSGGHGAGGGVFALGDVLVKYSTLAGNEAYAGGGLYLLGIDADPIMVADSAISGNLATGKGGGIYSKYQPLEIHNSTIAGNLSVFAAGSGLYTASPTELESTIIFGNTESGEPSDLAGPDGLIVSGAMNLVGVSTLTLPADTISADPMLGPLQDNGGLTQTQALASGSPAIDKGGNPGNWKYDQRLVEDTDQGGLGCVPSRSRLVDGCVFYEREVGAAADIGAFEFGAPDRIFTDGFDP
ncbi:MAG TPA: choice-of-anchor Q domain-containing protein [Rhodanobacteraceae bacterium]|nr:choice-of-anchor Q domain-containing protein [Rhodanobacteraceae bacterium]